MEAGPTEASGSLLDGCLERNVLFLGTGLNAGEEASDVLEVSEV